MTLFNTVLAFLIRDWRIRRSYRASWFIGIAHLLFAVTSFFFVSRLVDSRAPSALTPYGGAYFPFVFFGLLVSRWFSVCLSSVGGALRGEQLQGTLEALSASPLRLPVLVAGTLLWELLWATLEVAVVLGIGVVVFGVDLGRLNVLSCSVVSVLTALCLSGLGVFAASGVLLFQDADPTSWVLDGLMKLAGGVFVPVAILPGWLQTVAKGLPMTYGLEGVRQAVIMGRPLHELSAVCAMLAISAAVLWPASLAALSWVMNRLKAAGALSFR